MTFLELPGGIPSHDTFRRVFMLIDPEAFERCFLNWVRAVFRSQGDEEPIAPEQIAVDGKLIRHSFDRRQGRSPLHVVSAYATGRGLVLAQHAVDHKGGEPAALPVVLEGLHLDGCLVSLDALSCRRDVADHIVTRGADDLLTLKANQSKIHDEVRAWFAVHAFAPEAELQPCADAFDGTHGRLVRRREDRNRLGFAVQLALMRHPGLTLGQVLAEPDIDLTPLVGFVAEQLKLPASGFDGYAAREQTMTDHAGTVAAALGLRPATRADLAGRFSKAD